MRLRIQRNEPLFHIGQEVGVSPYVGFGKIINIRKKAYISFQLTERMSPWIISHGNKYLISLNYSHENVGLSEYNLYGNNDNDEILFGSVTNSNMIIAMKKMIICSGNVGRLRSFPEHFNIYRNYNDYIHGVNGSSLLLTQNAYIKHEKMQSELTDDELLEFNDFIKSHHHQLGEWFNNPPDEIIQYQHPCSYCPTNA